MKYISLYQTKLFVIILILFFVSITNQSCTTSIKTINKKQEKFDGKKVRISGKVISSLRLVDIMCFTIKDKSGNICVVTKNYLPIQGSYLMVKGVVVRNFSYEDRSLLVIKEHKLKSKKMYSWKNTKNKL